MAKYRIPWLRWLDYKLEIYFTLFFFAKHMSVPLTQDYVRNRIYLGQELVVRGCGAGVESFNSSSNNTNSTTNSTGSVQIDVADVVELSTLKVLQIGVVELLPSAVVVFLAGIWSDATGRRLPLLWISSLGLVAYSLGLLLEYYRPTENLIGLFIGAAIHGVTGNMPVFIVGANAYLSDNVPLRWRTVRLVVMEIIINVALGLGNFCAGIWINASGYDAPMWFLFAVSMLTFLLFFFALEDSDQQYEGHKLTFADFKNWSTLCHCSSDSIKRLWAVFVAYFLYSFVHQGTERTRVLFLSNSPLCYSELDIGIYILVYASLAALGTCIGLIPVYKYYFWDTTLVIIGLCSTLFGTVVFAWSTASWMLYLSAALMTFNALPYPVKRSIVSKQVSEKMQGSVQALLMGGQAFSMLLGPLSFNALYAASLHTMNGLVFVIAAIFMIPTLILMTFVCILDKNSSKVAYEDMDLATPYPENGTPGGATNQTEPAASLQAEEN